MKFLRAAFLIPAFLMVSAFDSIDIMHVDHSSNNVVSIHSYAGGNKDFLVQLAGKPFDVDQGVVDKAVTDAMQGADHGINARYSTTLTDPKKTYYRIVVLFEPPRTLNEQEACGDLTQVPFGKPGKRAQIQMVYCSGDFAESSISASAGAFSGTTDPRFRTVIRNMASLLIPSGTQEDNRSEVDGPEIRQLSGGFEQLHDRTNVVFSMPAFRRHG